MTAGQPCQVGAAIIASGRFTPSIYDHARVCVRCNAFVAAEHGMRHLDAVPTPRREPLTACEAVALDALRTLKSIEWIVEEPARGNGGSWRYCPSCGNVGAHSYDACDLASTIRALEHTLSGGAWPREAT